MWKQTEYLEKPYLPWTGHQNIPAMQGINFATAGDKLLLSS